MGSRGRRRRYRGRRGEPRARTHTHTHTHADTHARAHIQAHTYTYRIHTHAHTCDLRGKLRTRTAGTWTSVLVRPSCFVMLCHARTQLSHTHTYTHTGRTLRDNVGVIATNGLLHGGACSRTRRFAYTLTHTSLRVHAQTRSWRLSGRCFGESRFNNKNTRILVHML